MSTENKLKENWIASIPEILNKDENFRKISWNFNETIILIIQGDNKLEKIQSFIFKFRNGECIEALKKSEIKDYSFSISAPLATWKNLIQGESNLFAQIIDNKMKLSGNIDSFMKNVATIKVLSNLLQENEMILI